MKELEIVVLRHELAVLRRHLADQFDAVGVSRPVRVDRSDEQVLLEVLEQWVNDEETDELVEALVTNVELVGGLVGVGDPILLGLVH